MMNINTSEKDSHEWAYESIVDAIPGVNLSNFQTLAIQFIFFEGVVILIVFFYDLWEAIFPGSIAVFVIITGSGFMLYMGDKIRSLNPPEAYTKYVLNSKIDIVLGLLAYIGILTYIFSFNPHSSENYFLKYLSGRQLPIIAIYFMLLMLWDICYRISVGWLTSITGFFRSYFYGNEFNENIKTLYIYIDSVNILFAGIQLLLLPFVLGSFLSYLLIGHVIAVVVFCIFSIICLKSN